VESIIVFGPLLGTLIAGFGWRLIGETGAKWIATGLVLLSCLLSWVLYFGFDGTTYTVEVARWIQSGSLTTDWSFRIDRLTTIMLIVVTTVSSLVHVYSHGYMAHDENFRPGEESYRPRFQSYLSLFTFAMLMLVTSNDIVQLYFGWEGVGLVSYLLVGFYWRKPSAGAAALKAFLVNRVSDFFFSLGIFAVFYLTDSVGFDVIFGKASDLASTQVTFLWTTWNGAELCAFLLFLGAMGKSAQLLFHTWLPDAMEGPTPVSALIHAATMVTAGVFLVCRFSPLYEYAPQTMAFITFIGASTAFFAATIGLVQNDIKRVIAYSTCSQLGYMFVAAGVGFYPAAMFHLLTHAFFKALLFLSAGSVITAMHHEQDIRNYGGLRKKLPFTFWMMMIGTLAITGVGIPLTSIGFAGFLSKDAIIEAAWAGTNPLARYGFWMLVIAAAFTAFYSWRLMFLTFFGEARGDRHAHEHAKESPMIMLAPLLVLAVGATIAGMVWYGPFFGSESKVAQFFSLGADAAQGHFGAVYMSPDNHVLEHAHEAPAWVKVSPFIAMALGFLVALQMYVFKPDLPGRLARTHQALYQFLLNKWYFDELFDACLVRPTLALGRFLWKSNDDRQLVDGGFSGLVTGVVPWFARLAGRAQSGYIFHYAAAMVIGMALLITWMVLSGGAE